MMGSTVKARVATTDTEIDEAIERAKSYDSIRPRATEITYSATDDNFKVNLVNGVALLIPRKALQGLQNASHTQLADVQLVDFGSTLHWEALDVDHYVAGLLENILGTQKWMSHIGKKGGSARSSLKTKAVRKNGLMGGRPSNAVDPTRYRDESGEIRFKSGNTPLKSLRKTYGKQFAAGFRSNMKLDTLLERTGAKSLGEFQKKSGSSRRKK